MSIIIDIILVAILALCVFIGKRKGLTGYVVGILALAISIVLVLFVYKPVANLVINNTQMDELIESKITSMLKGTEVESGEEIKNSKDKSYSNVFISQVNKYVKEAKESQMENIIEYVAKNITTVIVYILTAITILIIANVVVRLLGFLLEAIAELPILKQFNDIGGTLVGFLQGVLIIYLIITVLTLVLPVINADDFMKAINESHIASFAYNHNFIMNLFTK